MASKFKLVVKSIFDEITHNYTKYTGSCKPNKKFSDVADYIRSGKILKILGGRVSQDNEIGSFWLYDYGNSEYQLNIKIQHSGEFINNMEATIRCMGSEYAYVSMIERMMKSLPDYTPTEAEKTAPVKTVEKEDYSKYNYLELLDLSLLNIYIFH